MWKYLKGSDYASVHYNIHQARAVDDQSPSAGMNPGSIQDLKILMVNRLALWFQGRTSTFWISDSM